MLASVLLLVATVEPGQGCAPADVRAPTAFTREVGRARRRLANAIGRGDRPALTRLYARDAVVMPAYQPSLRGPAAAIDYYASMRVRHGLTDVAARPVEVLDLRELAMETGEVTLEYGTGAARRGRYMAVWTRERDGGARLLSEAVGHLDPTSDPSGDVLSPAEPDVPGGDAGDAELLALNTRMEDAVRRRDAAARASFFAPDAVFTPFADTPKVGLDAIRRHLIEYNRGDAVIDAVRIWTERSRRMGPYVVEENRFAVRWHAGGLSGETSGKGLRLWWRAPDGQLKLCREMGSHDWRPVSPRATVRLREPGRPGPVAPLSDLAWLKGSWIGQMPQGPVEHVILGARKGHMPGFVRALAGDGLSFYEISLFAEVGASLTYRVKHFTPDLAGWEAQTAYVDRPLVARDGDTFYFDGITFRRTGADSFVVYFLPQGDGRDGDTLIIPFRRESSGHSGERSGLPLPARHHDQRRFRQRSHGKTDRQLMARTGRNLQAERASASGPPR